MYKNVLFKETSIKHMSFKLLLIYIYIDIYAKNIIMFIFKKILKYRNALLN